MAINFQYITQWSSNYVVFKERAILTTQVGFPKTSQRSQLIT